MNCNCLNCTTEGYFEFVNGFIPADCRFRAKVEPAVRGWEESEGSVE